MSFKLVFILVGAGQINYIAGRGETALSIRRVSLGEIGSYGRGDELFFNFHSFVC